MRSRLNLQGKPSKKAGFTLIEIIVTLVITIIIIGISGSIIISTTNIFGRSAMRDMQQTVAESVLSFATERMLYAYSLQVSNTPTDDTNTAVIGINTDGQFVYLRTEDTGAPINIFGSGFYHNYSVSLTYSITDSGSGNYSVAMEVVITDDRNNNVVLNRTMTRPLLNYHGPAVADVTIGKNTTNRYIIIG